MMHLMSHEVRPDPGAARARVRTTPDGRNAPQGSTRLLLPHPGNRAAVIQDLGGWGCPDGGDPGSSLRSGRDDSAGACMRRVAQNWGDHVRLVSGSDGLGRQAGTSSVMSSSSGCGRGRFTCRGRPSGRRGGTQQVPAEAIYRASICLNGIDPRFTGPRRVNEGVTGCLPRRSFITILGQKGALRTTGVLARTGRLCSAPHGPSSRSSTRFSP